MATKKTYPRTKPAARAAGSWARRKRAWMFLAGLVGGFGAGGFTRALSAVGAGVSARIATSLGYAAATSAVEQQVSGRVSGAYTLGAISGRILNELVGPRARVLPARAQASPSQLVGGAAGSAGRIAPGTSYLSSTVRSFGGQVQNIISFQQRMATYAVWPGVSPDLVKDLAPTLWGLLP